MPSWTQTYSSAEPDAHDERLSGAHSVTPNSVAVRRNKSRARHLARRRRIRGRATSERTSVDGPVRSPMRCSTVSSEFFPLRGRSRTSPFPRHHSPGHRALRLVRPFRPSAPPALSFPTSGAARSRSTGTAAARHSPPARPSNRSNCDGERCIAPVELGVKLLFEHAGNSRPMCY